MILKSIPMAISSSFASRLILCITSALLPSFVFYMYTSYAARVPQSLYGGPRMDANCIAIRSLYEFLTPSKISMFFSLGESSGRASTTIVGHGKPIDPHSERTELIQNVFVENIDPVVLLLGTSPEKCHQLNPKAMLAAYFRLLCIASRLPVEINVYDSNVAKIPMTVQDAVSNSSSRLEDLESTLGLPKLSIPGYALAMCAEVLNMPLIAPADVSATVTNVTCVDVFSPLDILQVPAAMPTRTTVSEATQTSLDTPSRPATSEDPRISPFSDIASADDLVDFFQGMTKAQLLVHARFTGANPKPFGESTTNDQIIASVADRIVSLREDDDIVAQDPPSASPRPLDSDTLRSSGPNEIFARQHLARHPTICVWPK